METPEKLPVQGALIPEASPTQDKPAKPLSEAGNGKLGDKCPNCHFKPSEAIKLAEARWRHIEIGEVVERILNAEGWEMNALTGAVSERLTKLVELVKPKEEKGGAKKEG